MLSKPVRPGEVLTVPRSRVLLLEVVEDSLVEVKLGPEAKIKEWSISPIPREWSLVADKIAKSSSQQRVVVLGRADCGKAYFCTFLINKLVEKSIRVGVLDCDPGGAEVAVPTTIALGLVKGFITSMSEVSLAESFFIGSTSPLGLEGRVTAGVRVLIERAVEAGVSTLVVNTGGRILGRRARLLEQELLATVAPTHIVLIQRGAEAEHLARLYEVSRGAEVLRVPAPPFIGGYSEEDERVNRELAFKAYFSKAKVRKFSLDVTGLMYTLFTTGFKMPKERLAKVEEEVRQQVIYGEEGPDSLFIVLKKPPPIQANVIAAQLRERIAKEEVLVTYRGAERGLVVGLLDRSHRLLGLGVIEEVDYEERVVNVLTPVDGEVGVIQVGQLKLDEEYREAAKVDGWPL